MPEIPSPIKHGWVLANDNILELVWSEGPVFPDLLIDLLPSEDDTESDPESDEQPQDVEDEELCVHSESSDDDVEY